MMKILANRNCTQFFLQLFKKFWNFTVMLLLRITTCQKVISFMMLLSSEWHKKMAVKKVGSYFVFQNWCVNIFIFWLLKRMVISVPRINIYWWHIGLKDHSSLISNVLKEACSQSESYQIPVLSVSLFVFISR